jgi:short-subunit dehydrogenase
MAVKTVLITGCSAGGIGSALVEAFQRRGLHVFATGRFLSKMSHLADQPNVTLLTLDVTDLSSISQAVKVVETQTKGTLDYLVNNSGVNYICPTLDVDIAKAKAMFDVNFWGVVACIQAFAPPLIAAKGTIINIGSILGLLATPYQSIYCASKAAISIFDSVLNIELAVFGVKVVTVITGSVESNINATGSGFEPPPNSRYAGIEAAISNKAHGKDIPRQMKSQDYAEKVVGDILGGASGKIWRGGSSTLIRYSSPILPQSMVVRYYLTHTQLYFD